MCLFRKGKKNECVPFQETEVSLDFWKNTVLFLNNVKLLGNYFES